jgi:hypothetical protein
MEPAMAGRPSQTLIAESGRAWRLLVLFGALSGCSFDSTAQNSIDRDTESFGAPTVLRAPDPAAPAATRIEEIFVPDPTPGEPVTAVMTIQPDRATAGETVEVLVCVRIASAHFIHAPGEAGGPFIPVAVNAQLPAGVEPVGDWQLPSPEKGRGTALVYRNSVVLRRSLKVVSMSASESLLVTGELRYQVCTDELCWPQGKLQLSAPLTIYSPRR